MSKMINDIIHWFFFDPQMDPLYDARPTLGFMIFIWIRILIRVLMFSLLVFYYIPFNFFTMMLFVTMCAIIETFVIGASYLINKYMMSDKYAIDNIDLLR